MVVEFKQVDPIPRGYARREGSDFFYGGAPRCPVCLKSCAQHNGYRMVSKHGASYSGFNCPRCHVWWLDTGITLCYLCEQPFTIPPSSDPHVLWSDTVISRPAATWEHGSCYHRNSIENPCCPSCSSIVGNKINHYRRRNLRRLVVDRVVS